MTAVGSVRTGDALVFGKTIFATAVDPGAKDVIDARLEGRLAGECRTLGDDGAFVDDGYAKDHDLDGRLAVPT